MFSFQVFFIFKFSKSVDFSALYTLNTYDVRMQSVTSVNKLVAKKELNLYLCVNYWTTP